MKKGIAIAGNLIVDHVKMIDSYPAMGMLTNIREVSDSIGGCAGNTICDLAIIDRSVPLKCIGRIGADADGNYILKMLESCGIDTSLIKKTSATTTSFTDVMTSLSQNERTFFHARGANAEFCIDDIPFDQINADIFHLGYALLLDKFDISDPDSEFGTVFARALAYAQKAGMKTSMDVVSENSDRFDILVPPCLKYCDYLIINEIEAAQTTGISIRGADRKIIDSEVKRVIEKMFSLGVSDTVCVHAPEGGWYSKKGGTVFYRDSLYLPKGYIKGKVGAGDAFCAGMLYSLYREFNPDYSLRVANAAAGANLSQKNSIDGMRDFTEMMKLDALYADVKPDEYC
ncbi:MAG: carbohydrate kinase family protein [Oscillospiraceae bacterium]|nr:carbohydrate kinase family protein [Oscillospiraceae bacterium]